jgi:ABC-type nitrate/sulfonate/bicarbonate transport system permease component
MNNKFILVIKNVSKFSLNLINFVIAETLFSILKIRVKATAYLTSITKMSTILKINIKMPSMAHLLSFSSTTSNIRLRMPSFLSSVISSLATSAKITIKSLVVSHALLYSNSTLHAGNIKMPANLLLGTFYTLGYYDPDVLGSLDSSTLGSMDFTT